MTNAPSLTLVVGSALLGVAAWLGCVLAGVITTRGVARAASACGAALEIGCELTQVGGDMRSSGALGAIVLARVGGVILLGIGGILARAGRTHEERGRGSIVWGGALVLALGGSGIVQDLSGATATECIIRATCALGLGCVLLERARTSVLAKVVAAVVGGALVATVAAGVSAGREASRALTSARHDGAQAALATQLRALNQTRDLVRARAETVGRCTITPASPGCASLRSALESQPHSFAVVVAAGRARTAPGSTSLERDTLLALGLDERIDQVSRARAGEALQTSAVTILPRAGRSQGAAIGVSQLRAGTVGVYGVWLDDTYLESAAAGSPYTLALRGDVHSQSQSFSENNVLARAGVGAGSERIELLLGLPGATAVPEQGVIIALARTGGGVLVLASLLALLVGERLARGVRTLTIGVLELPGRLRGEDTPTSAETGRGRRRFRLRRSTHQGVIGAGSTPAGFSSSTTRGGDEVAVLARAFEEMGAELIAQRDELQTRAEREEGLRTQLRATLDALGDAVYTLDLQGALVQVNPAGITLLEEIGAGGPGSLRDHLTLPGKGEGDTAGHGENGGGVEVSAVLAQVQDTGVGWSGSGLLGRVPVAVRVSALPAPATGAVVVLRDVRGEREVERMKTEFLSNVSHELRTPLTPIRGYVEILRSRPQLEEGKRREFLDTVSDATLRLGRVVDLLVDVAAIDANRIELQIAEVDVRGVLARRAQVWAQRPEGRGRDIRTRVRRGVAGVLTDETWLAKALDELIDNAVKYSPSETPITLEARPGQRGVEIHVIDRGGGIAEMNQGALFAAFTQADGSATRRVGGLGLGLSFVRSIAQVLGCGLVVQSSRRGSRFTLEVPTASGGAGSSEAGVRSPVR